MAGLNLDFSKDTIIIDGHVCKALPDKPYVYEVQDDYIISMLERNAIDSFNIRFVLELDMKIFPNGIKVIYIGDVFSKEFETFAEELCNAKKNYETFCNIIPEPLNEVSDPDTGEYNIDFSKDTIIIDGHVCKALPDNPSVYEVQGNYIVRKTRWENNNNHYDLRVLGKRYESHQGMCKLLYIGDFSDLKFREFIYNKLQEDSNYYEGYYWRRDQIFMC